MVLMVARKFLLDALNFVLSSWSLGTNFQCIFGQVNVTMETTNCQSELI